MRALASFCLFAVLHTAPLAAQLPRSPQDLPADLRQTLIERMGPDPFAALAAWHKAPRDAERPSWLPDRGEADAAWHWLLHTALWHADPDVAYAAACRLSYPSLDLAASERWLAVVWPHVFDADLQVDWDEVRRQLPSTDVARLLEVTDCWRAEVRPFFLGDMHRVMRPEHASRLAALAQCDDPFLRRGGFGNLGTLATYSDQHRDVIGKALLSLQPSSLDNTNEPFLRARNIGYAPREWQLPATRPGWSPLLRAALQRSLLELEKPLFWTFLLRWAEDETPADEDRLLLAALLDCGKQEGCWLALRTLARMPPDPHLQRRLESPPEIAPAALVLAARHDWPALRELAATDGDALAVAFEYDFDAAFLDWCALAFGADADAGLAAVERLIDVADTLVAPYRTNPRLPERLRQAIGLFGDRLDFARLHRLVEEIPAARSERLVELYWRTITPANLARCAAEVLEVSPSIPFRERLHEWGAAADAAVREPALELLLRLGDTELDEALIAHWQARHRQDPLLLARCGTAAVRHLLEEELRRLTIGDGGPSSEACDLLAATALALDLPADVARRWSEDLRARRGEEAVRERFERWRGMVLEGDGVGALLDDCATVPPESLYVYGLGQIDDDRVRELLRKVRSTPGAAVQAAIGELALAGDWQARQEIDELRHRHVYGWFDDATSLVRAGGRTLDLVPWLLGELETNCCRRNSAASALEFLYGFETHAMPEHALRTQAARAREHWRAIGEHLRWSELANRFVVAAH